MTGECTPPLYGILADSSISRIMTDCRGEAFLFNNLHRCMGRPVLLALIAGNAAMAHEKRVDSEIITRTITALRRVIPIARSSVRSSS